MDFCVENDFSVDRYAGNFPSMDATSQEMISRMKDQVRKTACEEIRRSLAACSERCLFHASKWLIELYDAMINAEDDELEDFGEETTFFDYEYEQYCNLLLARACFNEGEYARAAFFTQDCQEPVGLFIHFYASYLQLEQTRLDNTVDVLDPKEPKPKEPCPELLELKTKLHACMDTGFSDGFMHYLYGVICKRLKLEEEALKSFENAVDLFPLNWSAWQELLSLTTHKLILSKLRLPDHWIKTFFLAHAFLELQAMDAALDACQALFVAGFRRSLHVWTLVAVAHNSNRDSEESLEVFQLIRNIDPYRLDSLDVLSNLLYTNDDKKGLERLAQQVLEIDRFKAETCVIVGNHYSLREAFDKAAMYFHRALKINPECLSAWTLLGHVYMEMKQQNVNAAIQCYRSAIDVNPRDYRAWFGLGQTYDKLKFPFFAMIYYRTALGLRPFDNRIYLALAGVFESTGAIKPAVECYMRSIKLCEPPATIYFRWAVLLDKLKRKKESAEAFLKFISLGCEQDGCEAEFLPIAYKSVAEYMIESGNLVDARKYLNLLSTSSKRKEVREDSKALVKRFREMKAALAASGESSASIGDDEPEIPDDACADVEMEVETPTR